VNLDPPIAGNGVAVRTRVGLPRVNGGARRNASSQWFVVPGRRDFPADSRPEDQVGARRDGRTVDRPPNPIPQIGYEATLDVVPMERHDAPEH
jgi:hypothetical protein